jgi:hypothetical protein
MQGRCRASQQAQKHALTCGANAFLLPYHVDFDLEPGGWHSWPIPVIALGTNYVTDVNCYDPTGWHISDFHHEGVF